MGAFFRCGVERDAPSLAVMKMESSTQRTFTLAAKTRFGCCL